MVCWRENLPMDVYGVKDGKNNFLHGDLSFVISKLDKVFIDGSVALGSIDRIVQELIYYDGTSDYLKNSMSLAKQIIFNQSYPSGLRITLGSFNNYYRGVDKLNYEFIENFDKFCSSAKMYAHEFLKLQYFIRKSFDESKLLVSSDKVGELNKLSYRLGVDIGLFHTVYKSFEDIEYGEYVGIISRNPSLPLVIDTMISENINIDMLFPYLLGDEMSCTQVHSWNLVGDLLKKVKSKKILEISAMLSL